MKTNVKVFLDSSYLHQRGANNQGEGSSLLNKYKVLRSYDGDNLNQRVQGGTDRTEGMARISGINQMEPQKLEFQVL